MTKTCVKCEGRHIGVKYDKVLDLLDYKCETCEYRWSEYPADRLKLKCGHKSAAQCDIHCAVTG